MNPFLEKEKCPPVPKFQFTPHGNKFVGVNSGSIEASTAAPPFQSSSLSSSCGWGEVADSGELSFLSLAYFPFHFHFLERPVEISERSSIITSSQNQNQSSFLLRQGRIQIKCNMWKKEKEDKYFTQSLWRILASTSKFDHISYIFSFSDEKCSRPQQCHGSGGARGAKKCPPGKANLPLFQRK